MRRIASRAHPAVLAGWAAAVVCCVAAVPRTASAQGGSVRADSILLRNRATATYRDANGQGAVLADSASVAVSYVSGLLLAPPRQATTAPATRVVLAHTLTNTGSATDRFPLALGGLPAGWTATLLADVDGDGVVGPADTIVAAAQLAPGASLALLLAVDVPAGAADSTTTTLRLTAASARQPTVTLSVDDAVTVLRPRPSIVLAKTVDRARATAGDTLTYTLRYQNLGDAASGDAFLVDTLPASVRFVPGSLTRDGAAASDAAVATLSLPAGTRDLLRLGLGVLAPAASGVVTLRAVVVATQGGVANVAHVEHDGRMAPSGLAGTQLALADVTLAKEVVGATRVALGDTLGFRLRYVNASTLWARGVVLVDTLPRALQLVSATGAPQVAGQVVRWTLPDLAPGDSGAVALLARVIHLPDSATLVNRASISGTNVVAVSSTATGVEVPAPAAAANLRVTKTANLLEVGLGEAVPYTVTLRNVGTTPLPGAELTDVMPAGMRFAGTVAGADSARAAGGVLHIWIARDIAPGEQLTLRYALVLVSADAARLSNQVVAASDAGRILSDTATAWVRVRRARDTQTRMLVGKVWVDRNDNRRQDDGELGVPRVQLWTADGQILITDAEGRFSLTDVRPGSHTFRVDAASVPAGLRIPSRDEEVAVVRADGWTMPRVDFRLVPTDTGCSCTLPVAVQQSAGPLRLAALRTDSARAEDRRQELLAGPSVRFFEPRDGAVVHANRVYLGVRGEPGRPLRLYDGDSVLASVTTRGDSVYDFIGVQVAPGPHRFRVAMTNSWGQERWDSLTVHYADAPSRFVAPAVVPALHVDTDADATLRVRLVDRHGAPVAPRYHVTVDAAGVVLGGADSDPQSPGEQRKVDSEGYVTLRVRGGERVGPARVTLAYARTKTVVPLRVLPSVRPLIVTGAAQLAVGENVASFGQVTARGSLDRETSVSVSYDSYRTSREAEAFARDVDPLDPSRYPSVGDGSERRVLSSARGTLSARVERGYDWLAVGDVTPDALVGSGKLFTYQRAITGVDGRVTTGPVVWRGFGSMSSQRAVQRQLRATLGSGPYALGAGIRAGTEVVAIETRARDNAARIVNRETLVRYVDYDLDYESGTLLLRRVLPESDGYGNPIFVVALVEQRDGGPARFAGGLRGEVTAFARRDGADSVVLGFSVLHDQSTSAFSPLATPAALDVTGLDARLRRGGLSGELELLRAAHADTAALAGRASLLWTARDERFRAGAEWMQVEQGFGGSFDPRLGTGLREIKLGTSYALSPGARVELGHERQRFEQYRTTRENSYLRAVQQVRGRQVSQQLGVVSDEAVTTAGTRAATSANAKIQLGVTERLSVWVDGARLLQSSLAASQPDYAGGGVSYRLLASASAEAAYKQVQLPTGSSYTLSSLRLRTRSPLGGNVWGGVERAAAVRASNTALLGFDQKLRFARVWQLTGMYERRFGLEQASLGDPTRALPFAQAEPDRWTAAAGLAFAPGGDRLRGSALGELRQQGGQRSSRVSISGDAPFGADAALLARSDWMTLQRGLALGAGISRDDRSLMGFAFRPTRSDAFNMLAKVEWRRTMNPTSATTLGDSLDVRRLIGATDAVWALSPRLELAGRYAARWSDTREAGLGPLLAPLTHFAGVRAERLLGKRLAARADGRVLLEQTSGASTWSVTPSLRYRLTAQLQVEAGYRAGTLRDADFGTGPRNLFATLGVRFTERDLASSASFWRARLASTDR